MKSLKRIDAAIDAVCTLINETEATGSELKTPEMQRSFDVLHTLRWVRGRRVPRTPADTVRANIEMFNFLRGTR